MDVDVYEQIRHGGWEHIPHYTNREANSSSSAAGSSNALSPSLQSYLNAHDASWAGGDHLTSSPTRQQPPQRDPTAIYRAEIARIGRRFGLANRSSGGTNPQHGTAAKGSPPLGSRRSRFGCVGAVEGGIAGKKRGGLGPRRSYQVEGFLEQGWDGRVALVGKRSGRAAGRGTIIGPASRSDSSRIWDSPPPVRHTARSAGPTRSRSSGHTGLLSTATNLWDVAEGPVNTQVRGRRPSTAPAVQISSGGGQNGRRSRNDPLAGGSDIVGRWPSDSAEGHNRQHLPEISRSASPTPPPTHRTGEAASHNLGTGRTRKSGESYYSRRRPGVVPVRALLLLSDTSIGHEVSAVTMSPVDSVSLLRAAIQADIVRDTRGTTTKTGASSGAAGHLVDGGGSGCPLFSFSYADGVAIDRGQEERLSVKDIAINSSSPSAGAPTDCFDLQWEDGNGGDGGGSCTEMVVFLRASGSETEHAGTGDGSAGGGDGGVLHRWESLQAGAWGNEAFWGNPASTGSRESVISKGGGLGGSSSSPSFFSPTSSSSFDATGGYGGQRAGDRGYDAPDLGFVPLRTGSVSSSSLAIGIQQHTSRRFSVSFDETKAARRRIIQEQVILLASSKVTLISKVFRGYQARVLFHERLRFHRQASKIQLCVRQRAAKQELDRRVRCREKAVRIQCLARSRHSRRVATLRRDRRLAATRIQGSARSKAAKKELSTRRDRRRREAAADAARKEKEEEAREATKRAAREAAELHRIAAEEAAIARIQSFARTTGAKKEAKNRRERKKRAAAKKKIEQDEAALQLQCFSRVQAAKMEANERRKRKEAANRIQLKARQRAAKQRANERREAVRKVQQRREEEQRQAAVKIQAAAKGKRARARVRDINNRREDASVKITALARGKRGRRRARKMRQEKEAAVVIQKTARGRRGRSRSPPRRLAAGSEETAATLIQKVARGNTDRALFRHLKKDMDDTGLYGDMFDEGRSGNVAREQQQGGGASAQRKDGPKRVEFSTGALSQEIAENVAANMALDLDERVRSFVAVQATVRRAENMVRVASGDESDESPSVDGRTKNDCDFPLCAELAQHGSVSESDFLLSSSPLGPFDGKAEATGQDRVRASGFPCGYVSDDEKGSSLVYEGVIPAEDDLNDEQDADVPGCEVDEGQSVFKTDLALEDETGSILATPGASQSEDDKAPAGGPDMTGSGPEETFKSEFALDYESESALTIDTVEKTESRGNDSQEMEQDETEEEEWKSDFALETLESEGIEGDEEPTAGSGHAGNVSVGKRSGQDDGNEVHTQKTVPQGEAQQGVVERILAPTSDGHSVDKLELPKEDVIPAAVEPSNTGRTGDATEGVADLDPCGPPGGGTIVVAIDQANSAPATSNASAELLGPQGPGTSGQGGQGDLELEAYRAEERSLDVCSSDKGAEAVPAAVESANTEVAAVEDLATDRADSAVGSAGSSLPVLPDRTTKAVAFDRGAVVATGDNLREASCVRDASVGGEKDTELLTDGGSLVPESAETCITAALVPASDPQASDLPDGPLVDSGLTSPASLAEESVAPRCAVSCSKTETRLPEDSADPIVSAEGRGSSDMTDSTLVVEPGLIRSASPPEDAGEIAEDTSLNGGNVLDVVASAETGVHLEPSSAGVEADSAEACHPAEGIEAAPSVVESPRADGRPTVAGLAEADEGGLVDPGFIRSASSTEEMTAVDIDSTTMTEGDATKVIANVPDVVDGGKGDVERRADSVASEEKSMEVYSVDAEDEGATMMADDTNADAPRASQRAAGAADGSLIDSTLTGPASPTEETTAAGIDQPPVETTSKCRSEPANGIGIIRDRDDELQDADEGLRDTDVVVEGQSAEPVLSLAVGSADADSPATKQEVVDGADNDVAIARSSTSPSPDEETPGVAFDQPAVAPTGSDANQEAIAPLGAEAKGEQDTNVEGDGATDEGGLVEGFSSETKIKAATASVGNANADAVQDAANAAGEALGDPMPVVPAEETAASATGQSGVTPTGKKAIEGGVELQNIMGGAEQDMNPKAPGVDREGDLTEASSSPRAGRQPASLSADNADITTPTYVQEMGGTSSGTLAVPGVSTSVPEVAVDEDGPAGTGGATEKTSSVPDDVSGTDENPSLRSVDEEPAAVTVDHPPVATTAGGSFADVDVRHVAADSGGGVGFENGGAGAGSEGRSGEDGSSQVPKADVSTAIGEASGDAAGPNPEGADPARECLANPEFNTPVSPSEETPAAATDQPTVAPTGSDATEDGVNPDVPVPSQEQATGDGVDNTGVPLIGDGPGTGGVFLQDDATADGRVEDVSTAGTDAEQESVGARCSQADIAAITNNPETVDHHVPKAGQETADVGDDIPPDPERSSSRPPEEETVAAGNDQFHGSRSGKDADPPEAGNTNAGPAGYGAIDEANNLPVETVLGSSASQCEDSGRVDIDKSSIAPAGGDTDLTGMHLRGRAAGTDSDADRPKNGIEGEGAAGTSSTDRIDSTPQAMGSIEGNAPAPKEEPVLSAVVVGADDTAATCIGQPQGVDAPENEDASTTVSGPLKDPEEAEARQTSRVEIAEEKLFAVDEGIVAVTDGSSSLPPVGDTEGDQTEGNARAHPDQEDVPTEKHRDEQPVIVPATEGTGEQSALLDVGGEEAADVPSSDQPAADADAREGVEPAKDGPLSALESEQGRTATIGDDSVLEKQPISLVPEIEVQDDVSHAPEGVPEETHAPPLATSTAEALAESATDPMVALADATPGVFGPTSAVVERVPAAGEDVASVTTAEAAVSENVSKGDGESLGNKEVDTAAELPPLGSAGGDREEPEMQLLEAAAPASPGASTPRSEEPVQDFGEKPAAAAGPRTLASDTAQTSAAQDDCALPPSHGPPAVGSVGVDENLTGAVDSAVPDGAEDSPSLDDSHGVTGDALLTTSAQSADAVQRDDSLATSEVGEIEIAEAVELAGEASGEAPLLDVAVGGEDFGLLEKEDAQHDATTVKIPPVGNGGERSVQPTNDEVQVEQPPPALDDRGLDAEKKPQVVVENLPKAEPLGSGPASGLAGEAFVSGASDSICEPLESFPVEEVADAGLTSVSTEKATEVDTAPPAGDPIADPAHATNLEPLAAAEERTIDAPGSLEIVGVVNPGSVAPSAEVASNAPEEQGVERARSATEDVADDAAADASEDGSVMQSIGARAGVAPADSCPEAASEQAVLPTEPSSDSAEIVSVVAPNEDATEEEIRAATRSVSGAGQAPQATDNLPVVDGAGPTVLEVEEPVDTTVDLRAPGVENATAEEEKRVEVHGSDAEKTLASVAKDERGSLENHRLYQPTTPVSIPADADEETNVMSKQFVEQLCVNIRRTNLSQPPLKSSLRRLVPQNVDDAPTIEDTEIETKPSEGSEKGEDATSLLAPPDDGSSLVPDNEVPTPAMGESGPVAIDTSVSTTEVPAARESKEEDPAQMSEQTTLLPGESLLVGGSVGVESESGTPDVDNAPTASDDAADVVKGEEQQDIMMVPDADAIAAEDVVQDAAKDGGPATPEIGDEYVTVEAGGANDNTPTAATIGSPPKADATANGPDVAKSHPSHSSSEGPVESQVELNDREAATAEADEFVEVERLDAKKEGEGARDVANVIETPEVLEALEMDVQNMHGENLSGQVIRANTIQEVLDEAPAVTSRPNIPDGEIDLPAFEVDMPQIIAGDGVATSVLADGTVETSPADVPFDHQDEPTVLKVDAAASDAANKALGVGEEMPDAEQAEKAASIVESDVHGAAVEQLLSAPAAETPSKAGETVVPGGETIEMSPTAVPDEDCDEPLIDEEVPQTVERDVVDGTAAEGDATRETSPAEDIENPAISASGVETPRIAIEDSVGSPALEGGTAAVSSPDTPDNIPGGPFVEAAEEELCGVNDTPPSTSGAGDEDGDTNVVDPIAATAETVVADGVEKDGPLVPALEEEAVAQEVIQAPVRNMSSDTDVEDTPNLAQAGQAAETVQQPATAAAEGTSSALTSTALGDETPEVTLPAAPGGNKYVPVAGVETPQTEVDSALIDTVLSAEVAEVPPPPVPTEGLANNVDDAAAFAVEGQTPDTESVNTEHLRAAVGDKGNIEQPPVTALPQTVSAVEIGEEGLLTPDRDEEEIPRETMDLPAVVPASEAGDQAAPELEGKATRASKDVHGPTAEHPAAAAIGEVPSVVRVKTPRDEQISLQSPPVVTEEKLDGPVSLAEMPHKISDDVTASVEGITAEQPSPAEPKRSLDAHVSGVEIPQAMGDDGASTAVLERETAGLPPPDVPPRTQNGATPLVAENEAPTGSVDKAVVTAGTGDESQNEDEQPPIAATPQTEAASGGSEDSPPEPKEEEAVATQEVIGAPVVSIASDAGVEALAEVEQDGQTALVVEDVHGPTGEHPAVAATDEVSSLALESTPRDGETGEELRKAVTEDEPDDPLSEIGVPQANSDNTTTGTEGGTAEESPPAEPDRSLDAPVLGFEIPHAVTDAGAAADILEGMTAGVSPPPVPPGIQSETAPLVAEDESTGSVDETVVTPRSGNGFRNEGVSERPQVALVPQTEAASGASEDSPLLPKHEEEEAINAPATSISSDEGVEATPEAYQVGQMAEAVEDAHDPTGKHPAAATTSDVPSEVRESAPQDGEIAEAPDAATEQKLDEPVSDLEVPHTNLDDIAARTGGETADESPPAEPERSPDAPVSGVEKPPAVVNDTPATGVPEGETTAGVPQLAVPPGMNNEATPRVAGDESTEVIDKAVVTVTSGDGSVDEGDGEQLPTAAVPQTEAAPTGSEDGPPEPKEEEAAATQEAIDAPAVIIASDAGVGALPEVERDGQPATAVEDIHGPTAEHPATDDVPSKVRENTRQDEETEVPPNAVVEDKPGDSGAITEVPPTITDDIAASVEGEAAGVPPPAVPDRHMDAPVSGVEMPQAVADDGTAAALEGETGETAGVPPPIVSPGAPNEATLLVAEDEPTREVDMAVVTAAAGDESRKDGVNETPIATVPQTEETSGAVEDGPPVPKHGEEVIMEEVIDAPSVSIASDAGVEALAEVEQADQTAAAVEDVHGLTAGHPTPAATDEVPSVIRENTPQERGIAEVPQNVGTEDKLQDPLSEAEVPHKSSDVMAASAEKETAEALPPAEPDQILDAPVSGVEVPQPVVDDREQNTAGVPPPPVPPGIQNEATVLVAEDESSGGVDKAGATAATGDEPGDEGVAEQQPHIEAAAGASEDGTPEPKQEEQAVEPDAVDVGIASDVSVEATPETDEKASTALQQSAHYSTVERPEAAAIDKVVLESTPHEDTAEEPAPAVTAENLDGPGTVVEAPQAVSENSAVTTDGETAEEPPPAVPARSMDVPALDVDVPPAVADDGVTAPVVDGGVRGGSTPALSDRTENEPGLLAAEDESSGAVSKAVEAAATGDESGEEGASEQPSIAVTHQTEVAAGASEDGLSMPRREEEVIIQNVVEAPVGGIASDVGVGSTPEVEKVEAVFEDINGVTVEHPVVTATGEVPPVLNTTCTPQDGEIAQEPRPTATDENVNYSVTGVEAPQAASEDTAATDEAEAREGPPTTTLDRSRDGSFLKAGTPHVVAATAILEGEATGGPPPAVPNENQGEPTLLMAGDESTGAIDKAAVSSTTGDEPGDDGVIEQPPIAAVSQTAEAGGGEDGPPIPKQAEEAIAEDAIAAPVESIALNAEVESTSETGQTSVALEDVDDTTVDHPVAAPTDEAPPVVELAVLEGGTAEVSEASGIVGDVIVPDPGVGIPIDEEDAAGSVEGATCGTELTSPVTAHEESDGRDASAADMAEDVPASAIIDASPAESRVEMKSAKEGNYPHVLLNAETA